MSLWDRYFAPGDIRQQRQELAAQHLKAEQQALNETVATRPLRRAPVRVDPATRARRQNGLLFGGVIFTALSIFVTRRAVARKILSTPTTASTTAQPNVSPSVAGGLDAAQALSLATLNVFSIGTLATGVAVKAFDIADVEDLRDKVRKGVGFDVYGGDEQADKELETWVADILSRKDGVLGLRESVAEKLAELQKLEQKEKEQKILE